MAAKRKIEQWAASLGVTPENAGEPKLTQREHSAQEQHRMDTTDWVAKLAETNDQIRAQEEVRVRAQLEAEDPGHSFSDEDIKAHVALTHSDAANKRRAWEHQKVLMERAQADHDAAQAVKATTKVKRDNEDRLAHEKLATAEAVKNAETWKKRADVERDRYESMMKQQHRR